MNLRLARRAEAIFGGWGAQIEEKSNARSAQIVAQREQQQLWSNKGIVASEQITAAL
jgi:hypothetical protein